MTSNPTKSDDTPDCSTSDASCGEVGNQRAELVPDNGDNAAMFSDEDVAAMDAMLRDLAADEDDEGEDEKCHYDRQVTLFLPAEAGSVYGVTYISVPARDFLTWFASNNLYDAELAINIRDDFYSGDHEDDYSYQIDSGPIMVLTAEQRAEIRVSLERSAEERAKKRALLEAEHKAAFDDAETYSKAWHPTKSGEAFDAKQGALSTRHAELEDEWDAFVRQRESWGDDRAVREAATRSSLLQKEAAIQQAFDELLKRW